jgi:Response regulators consisting of a CheY-like receiver domain and a winged-helix DNA-binding domain
MAANKILVVEDDRAILELIQINLQVAGYECQSFGDGGEAASFLESDHSFDLALLDIMLPGLDGFELMPIMQQYNIPVIYLTAKADVASKVKGLKEGAEDYIVKPFEILELLVRIEKVLERSGRLNRVIRIKDVTIDLEKRSVTRAGEEIALKPLEFDVLALLAKYKNRTMTRERLLNEIWGVDFVGETRTVDVHIANIRKKLDLNDEIKTISKTGYRLED